MESFFDSKNKSKLIYLGVITSLKDGFEKLPLSSNIWHKDVRRDRLGMKVESAGTNLGELSEADGFVVVCVYSSEEQTQVSNR